MPVFPPAADRVAWDAVRERLGAAGVAGMLARAEESAAQAVAALVAADYLNSPERYEQAAVERRRARHRLKC